MTDAAATTHKAPHKQEPPYAGKAKLVGIIGLVIAFIGLVLDPTRGGQAWLIGYVFWFAICVGCLMLTQVSYLFDAGWSTIIRRQWEHVLAAFPWLFVLLLPVLIIPMVIGYFSGHLLWDWMAGDGMWQWLGGDPVLYPGAHPVAVSDDVLYGKKAPYLNIPFFLLRICIYFGVFCGLSFLLRYFSTQNDQYPDRSNYHHCRKLVGIGVPLTALALTFAAFDLFMSLSYHWFSTMYGVWFFAASMRAGLAATVIICVVLARKGSLQGIFNDSHLYYLGCLKLAFTVFWAYIVFSQYFLIYNANIPEETFWYNMRQLSEAGTYSSWWWVGLILIFGNFFLPFFLLLSHRNKVVQWRLFAISIWVLVFAMFDYYYNILPMKHLELDAPLGYTIQQFVPSLFDLAALVGVGGIVVWSVLRSMAKHAPIPLCDPRINESLHASH